jgi:hypothetical protein
MIAKEVPLQLTALFVDPRDWRAAKELGKATKTSAGQIVRTALSEYLKRITKRRK